MVETVWSEHEWVVDFAKSVTSITGFSNALPSTHEWTTQQNQSKLASVFTCTIVSSCLTTQYRSADNSSPRTPCTSKGCSTASSRAIWKSYVCHTPVFTLSSKRVCQQIQRTTHTGSSNVCLYALPDNNIRFFYTPKRSWPLMTFFLSVNLLRNYY